jgi:hypothetical protein
MGVELVCHVEGETQLVFKNRVLREIFRPKRDEVNR